MIKPDYTEWSKALLIEIYYTPEDKRPALIEDHLKKVHQRGYRDGETNGWWKEIDKEN